MTCGGDGLGAVPAIHVGSLTWVALRLLRYMVCIWERRLAKSPGKPLPVILPVVLAQNDRAWKTRPEFSTLFELPEAVADDLRPFIPDFLFRLIQLAEIDTEDLVTTF